MPSDTSRSNRRAVLRAWWRDPVDYRWLVRTFEARSALGPMKFIVGLGGAVMCAISVLTQASSAGPIGVVGHTVDLIIAVVAALWALRWWLLPWPRAAESLLLIGLADVLITAACLVDSNRLYGALGAVQLVVTGGYISIFHGPRVLAAHAVWSVLSVLGLTMLMVADETGDVALGLAIVLIMVTAIVVVLPGLQFCYWVLRKDALSDPLTMLLNRRGLEYHLTGLFTPGDHRPICVMLIDLDRFKSINDTFGHSVGDEILARTATQLRTTADPDAILARTGGEEFVVITHQTSTPALSLAQRLCDAIATTAAPYPRITASIGVALHDGDPPTTRTCEDLLSRADIAMYRAKQQGGNTIALADRYSASGTPKLLRQHDDSHSPGMRR